MRQIFVPLGHFSSSANISLASVASKSTRVWNKCFAITRSQIAETKTVEDCELHEIQTSMWARNSQLYFQEWNYGSTVTQSCCRELLYVIGKRLS